MNDDLGPYARLYIRLRDDEKFETIYADDHAFAAYCRLLMIAESAWPTSAHLPHLVHRRSIAKLELVGLIELRGAGMFRIVGLDKERERRSAQASKASTARWNAASNAPSNAGSNAAPPGARMPNQERVREREQTEQETSNPDATPEVADPFDAYWSLTTRYPKDGAAQWLDSLTTKYGTEPVIRQLVVAWTAETKLATLLSRTETALAREARALDRREQEQERERLREKRAIPRLLPAWEQEYRAALEQKYGDAAP